MQLEDILRTRNGLMGNWENGELPRMAGLSPFGRR